MKELIAMNFPLPDIQSLQFSGFPAWERGDNVLYLPTPEYSVLLQACRQLFLVPTPAAPSQNPAVKRNFLCGLPKDRHESSRPEMRVSGNRHEIDGEQGTYSGLHLPQKREIPLHGTSLFRRSQKIGHKSRNR